MAKFKVGDRVKFVGYLSTHNKKQLLNKYSNALVVIYIGRYIIKVSPYNVVEGESDYYEWYTYKNELELVEKEPLIKIDETVGFRTADEILESFKDTGILSHYTDDNTDLSQWLQGEKILNHDDFIDSLRYAINDIKMTNDMINEGDVNMKNEVLKLYYEKKREEIIDKYEKKEQEYFAKNELANKFNELVETFEENLESLYKSVENFDNDYIVQRYDENNYKYKVNTDKISKEFEEKYIEKRNKELAKLDNEIKEISAQLSMSDDLDYQVEVLTRYGVLYKKTKKMAD